MVPPRLLCFLAIVTVLIQVESISKESCSSSPLIFRPVAVPSAGFVPVPSRPCVSGRSIHVSKCRVSASPNLKLNSAHRKGIPHQNVLIQNKLSRGDTAGKRRHYIVAAALLVTAASIFPSPCSASSLIPRIPSPNELKNSLISILDEMSHSGTKGMIVYTLSFLVWTMTLGVTTPVETAAGMAFPLSKSIPLSAIGKIGGAFAQFALAKYVLSGWARKKMEKNEWFNKINSSFKSNPFGVALIWRFSPLPEFVKNVGPALVPTLKTRYQILATLVHGLPFTVLWSLMGNEAAMVARGGQASVMLKRLVAGISWVGLFVSPTLFGWWLKGLGSDEYTDKED